MPANWQDTNSGVFALAATTLILGLATLPTQPARITAYALLTAVVAYLVDVYLY